ncbi:hypothetical protein D9M68_619330 [compost metagenome]
MPEPVTAPAVRRPGTTTAPLAVGRASVKPRVRITLLSMAPVSSSSPSSSVSSSEPPRTLTALRGLPLAACAMVGRKGWPFCSA